jgi:hypothetical protein
MNLSPSAVASLSSISGPRLQQWPQEVQANRRTSLPVSGADALIARFGGLEQHRRTTFWRSRLLHTLSRTTACIASGARLERLKPIACHRLDG